MKFALETSKPESVYRLFCEQLFNIPVYQRPYEWEIDKCEKLWDDIYSYFDTPDEVGYFLGILVLIKQSHNQFDVVDGQQRLISLLLLLRALYQRAGENVKVRQCLYVLDDAAEQISGFRLTSEVHGNEEQKPLQHWLSADTSIREANEKSNNTYERNLSFFRQKADTIPAERVGAFIRTLLDTVYLLPVFCEDIDKALTIFETINNRGQDLTDADIFKALLYEQAKKDNTEKDFIDQWNELGRGLENWKETKNDPRTFLFRCYMHILRGSRVVEVTENHATIDKGDTTKTVGMRSFFIDGRVYKKEEVKEYKLTSHNWGHTLDALGQIKQAWIILNTTNDDAFQNWKCVLKSFKNDVWIHPLVTFIYVKIRDGLNIDEEHGAQPDKTFIRECCQFMKNIIRFLYSKGFDSTLEMRAVQDEMFRATVCAAKGRPYQPNIRLHDAFKEKLRGTIKSPDFRKGFCALLEMLTQLHRVKNGDLLNVKYVFQKVSVEHILPQHWEDNYYDTWDKGKVDEVMNTLGNLCPLENVLNIKGSHNFFSKKRSTYCNSEFMTARELTEAEWTVDTYQKRHDRVTKSIWEFLSYGCED